MHEVTGRSQGFNATGQTSVIVSSTLRISLQATSKPPVTAGIAPATTATRWGVMFSLHRRHQ